MILVDSNSICHMAKHSMKGLSWHEMKVGVIFGFLRQILSLAKTFETNKFIFVWDSKESLRKDIFPAYKEKRKSNKSEEDKELDALSYPQFDALRDEIVPSLGFKNNYIQKGYEADDLIAEFVRNNVRESKATIVSTDEDLYQLLSENVVMYSIRRKQTYTMKNLYKDYGVTPAQWIMVKAIAGCSTDEVPGIVGVGEKTAAKYLTKKLNVNSKTFQSIVKGGDIIARNLALVELPFEGVFPLNHDRDMLDLRKFIDVCSKYGFQSFLARDTFLQWRNFVFERS